MNSFDMDNNFDDFTARSSSSTVIPTRQAPGHNTLGLLENGASTFNGNSVLWAEMGKMHNWRDIVQSKLERFEKLVETQAGVIENVKQRNAELEKEVQELKHQVAKSAQKKTRSRRDSFLSVIFIVSFSTTRLNIDNDTKAIRLILL